MASTDAKSIPQKNVALRITFPIFDADGDLVTGATGLDSEVSKDGGTFADCTNEATEIATSSGMYFLDLTSTEMNADTVAVIVKTSSVGAKTTPIVMYTAARSVNDLAFPNTSGRGMDVDASGGVEVGSFQAGALTNAAFAAGAIDAAAIAADAIGSSELAATAATEIAAAVWDEVLSAAAHNVAASAGLLLRANAAHHIATAQAGAAGTITLAAAASSVDSFYVGTIVKILEGTGVGQSRLITAYVGATRVATVANNWATTPDNTSVYAVLPARSFVPVGGMADDSITAGVIATDAIGSAELAASAVSEIQTGLATSAALATVQADTDDIQSRLPAALVSGRIDASVGAMAANVVTAAAIATDAIDADAIKADAVTEIQSGLATAAALDAVDNFVDTEIANIQSRLPAALVGGRMDSSVGAIAAAAITAAAIATGAIDADSLASDAVAEIWAFALAELSAVPSTSATPTVAAALMALLQKAVNEKTTDRAANEVTIAKADGTVIGTAAVDLTGDVLTVATYA